MTAAIGFVLLRGFNLRAMFMAIACFGAIIAACLNCEGSFSNDQITLEKASGEIRLTVLTSNPTNISFLVSSRSYIMSTFEFATEYLIIGSVPLLALPPIFKWRTKPRGERGTKAQKTMP